MAARQQSADGEVQHHALARLARAAQRRDLQVGHGREHARGQPGQAVPDLVLVDRGPQHQCHAGETGQHRGHQPAVDAVGTQQHRAAHQEQRGQGERASALTLLEPNLDAGGGEEIDQVLHVSHGRSPW